MTAAPPAETATIPIVEETATVARRETVTGRVRVSTRTEAFAETLEVALESADAVVTRVPVDRYLETGAPLPQPRTEGAMTIVPIFEEVLIIEKRILLKEEVHVELRRTVEQASIPTSVRRQSADIERLADPISVNPETENPTQE